MASPPLSNREGEGGRGGEESDETSRIFCGHDEWGERCMWGTKSNNHKEGGLVIANNTLQTLQK